MENDEITLQERAPRTRTPKAPSENGATPQAISVALLVAQGNDCKCRPCQLLRKAVGELSDNLLKEPAT